MTPSESARTIGVMFDANMSMITQITTMCRSAWYQLGNIREVRQSLTTEATFRLVCALMFSRIDYGNILLYGAPGCLLQNSAARSTIGSHYTHPLHTALAAGQTANSVQTACYHLQGPTWECTILLERDVTAISIYTNTAL